MDLKALKYFVSVYENQSFSAAAVHCYIAQPSISAAIQQLESSLQCQLFTRHARGVTPTSHGDLLYQHAVSLLGQSKAITALFTEASNSQPFRLGLVRALGVDRMSRLLKEFSARVPELELTLVEPEQPCDARIIHRDMCSKDEHFVPMWQDEYALAVPLSHPLALQSEVNLNDFDGLAFIERAGCHAWDRVSKELIKRNIRVTPTAHIQTIEYAMGLVRAEVGCALVPKIKQILSYPDVVFRPVTELKLKRDIGLAYQIPSSKQKAVIGTSVDAMSTLIRLCKSRQRK
ncbi:LysR family transcriptional regulator [Flocculibacter collagenilyticus]|uniref:LysR family transcriptional regulator n=1 Tax=Flocculibacter collagenilyticus TaxID=2744479 RepID=UPI0018F3E49B|nr:LysR family transcriptional regulator [Flocculibacter collagenilyticus]